MEQEKKYGKLGMFLFLAFAIISIMFATQVYKFVKLGEESINEKRRELLCSDLDYDVENLQYRNNELAFSLVSNDYDTNISIIKVVLDSSEEAHSLIIEPRLMGGDSKVLKISNINLSRSIYVVAEGCDKNGVTKTI